MVELEIGARFRRGAGPRPSWQRRGRGEILEDDERQGACACVGFAGISLMSGLMYGKFR